MTELHPAIEPYEGGMLDVGDGNRVCWEVCGHPDGKAALVVHGGPGSGSRPGTRRIFDRWLLYGGSWGSTLILAYAEQYPRRVSEIVISGVTTTRRSELDWLYRGAGRFFPEQWERFLAGAPGLPRDGDIVGAYARLAEDPDAAVRQKATADWCAWEDAVLSAETEGNSRPYGDRLPPAKLAFVRICTRYFAHGAWLPEGILLREAHRLAGIPGVLIQGRLDIAGPLDTAWQLSRAWPGAHLVVVDDAGHLGSITTRGHVLDALDRFGAG